MPKFRIKWQEDVIQYWYTDVEAENEEEARNLFYNGDVINGDEVLDDTQFIDKELNDVEELCEHSFVDENNDGKEVCRFCGETK